MSDDEGLTKLWEYVIPAMAISVSERFTEQSELRRYKRGTVLCFPTLLAFKFLCQIPIPELHLGNSGSLMMVWGYHKSRVGPLRIPALLVPDLNLVAFLSCHTSQAYALRVFEWGRDSLSSRSGIGGCVSVQPGGEE